MKNKLLMTKLCIAFSLPFIVHSAENVAESASINMESVLRLEEKIKNFQLHLKIR